MGDNEIDSKAFRDAMLRSDRCRIIAILAVLGILALLSAFRMVVFEWTRAARVLGPSFIYLGTASLNEILMLVKVPCALKAGSDLSRATWVANILVETLFPTLGMALMIVTGLLNPYQVLVAPVVLTYFIFIALSTLKLSPMLASLAGVSSAAGYGAVVVGVYLLYLAPQILSRYGYARAGIAESGQGIRCRRYRSCMPAILQ